MADAKLLLRGVTCKTCLKKMMNSGGGKEKQIAEKTLKQLNKTGENKDTEKRNIMIRLDGPLGRNFLMDPVLVSRNESRSNQLNLTQDNTAACKFSQKEADKEVRKLESIWIEPYYITEIHA